MTDNYRKAYTEVLYILKYLPRDEILRIPREKLIFYKENMDKNYVFKFDPQVDLSKQNISTEANAVIVSLFRDYFATAEQKEKLKLLLNKNQE